MTKQTVPDLDFNGFVIAQITDLFAKDKIYINKEYQRSDIWKQNQKVELIRSIINCYSIGVLVLFVNEKRQYEILDGQQRLQTIKQYLEDKLDLSQTDIQKYSELGVKEKALLDAYCIYYLKLKSHDPRSKEEDIIQVFLRLQEGTPLNKAEKINAHRGKFKDAFRNIRDTHRIFTYLGTEKRFRFRQLAAELLTLELEGDFKNKVFPSLDLASLLTTIKKYEKNINANKLRFFKGNLDYLHNSLNILLTAFKLRELISFYLLISYLRKHKTNKENLVNEFAEFARRFLKNLNQFSIYDSIPPKGMSKKLFDKYMKYKLEAKKMTTADSIKTRFEMILSEFKRLHPYIEKDSKRLHDTEQKRTLYFRQKGLCVECKKTMRFRGASSHHVIAYSEGGRTDDLRNAKLLHEKCHQKLEKRKKKKKRKLKGK